MTISNEEVYGQVRFFSNTSIVIKTIPDYIDSIINDLDRSVEDEAWRELIAPALDLEHASPLGIDRLCTSEIFDIAHGVVDHPLNSMEALVGYIGNTNRASSAYGPISNSIIFRHARIEDRTLSLINQRLMPNIQASIKSKLSSISACFDEMFTAAIRGSDLDDTVLAFRKGKSYIEHARLHLQSRSVVSVDISKFYNSISMTKVLRHAMLYHMFAALFRMNTGKKFVREDFEDVLMYDMLDKIFIVLSWQMLPILRFLTHNAILPTGMPYSPVVSNLLFLDTDYKIKDFLSLEYDNSVVYTRYADDMCISTIDPYTEEGFKLNINTVRAIEQIVQECDFYLKYDKTKIMGPRDKKVIAGLILDQSSAGNFKLSIGSNKKLELKQQFEGREIESLTASERGVISWVKSVNQCQHDFIVSGIIRS